MSLKSHRASGRGSPPSQQTEPPAAPRPFRRRPWFLAASAVALAAWLTFLSVMAWQQWREEKKGRPLLREEETAGEAAGDQ